MAPKYSAEMLYSGPNQKKAVMCLMEKISVLLLDFFRHKSQGCWQSSILMNQ